MPVTDDGTFEVEDDFLLVGPTFEENLAMFGLRPADLRGRSVLDCGGGAGAITAVAAALAERAFVVDPMYGPPASALVDPVAEVLRETGLECSFRRVPYEFQPGATEALVVTDLADCCD